MPDDEQEMPEVPPAQVELTFQTMDMKVDDISFTSIVAFNHGCMVGQIELQVGKDTLASFRRLFVVPQLRHKGIGRMLLKNALTMAKLRGASVVGLDVVQSNTRAMSLYAWMGFRPIHNDGTEYMMVRFLTPPKITPPSI